MTKNPFVSAVTAAVYIVLVVFVMSTFVDNNRFDNTLFVPMIMLSLFTLSAAVMGYLFLAQTFRMYFDGDKTGAMRHFFKITGAFAVIVAVAILGLFAGVF